MKVSIITTEELRNSEVRNYNPQAWERNINRFIENYKDVVFYMAPKDDIYTYVRHYVEYTLPDGLRLFSSFGYGSTMTNGGFYRLDKFEETEDGRSYVDVVSLMNEEKFEEAKSLLDELDKATKITIELGKFIDKETGKPCILNTTPQARRWMTEQSIKNKVTFAKSL